MKMSLSALVIIAIFALFLLAEPAKAADQRTSQGCAYLSWTVAGRSRSLTADHEGLGPTCGPSRGDIPSSLELVAGSCYSVFVRHTGDAAATAPTGVNLYMYYEDSNNLHGVDGAANWNNPIRKHALGALPLGSQSVEVCATADGTPSGAPRAGVFRLVLRACAYAGPTGDGCAGTTRVYDINTDDEGAPGTAVVVSTFTGVWRSGSPLTCFQDSTTPGGADIARYVSGDVPRMRACSTPSWGNFGHETYRASTIPQAGGAPIATATTTTAATGTMDASLPRIVSSDSYIPGTSPTKRLSLGGQNARILGIPWTYWTSAPADATFTSATQVDAAWGQVDKSLSTSCMLHDPVTGTPLAPLLLQRSEQVQCRQTTLQNARGEPLPAGSILRVSARRMTEPPLSPIDAFPCDVTTSTPGTWTCDVTLRATAATTSGLAYVIDVATYEDAARSVLLTRATIPALFDVTDALAISGTGANCNADPLVPKPVLMLGEPAAISWRVCNARGQSITPALTVRIVRDDNGATDHGPLTIAPVGGTYSWNPTMSGGRAHTLTGLPKNLHIEDAGGNSATRSQALNVSDRLSLPPPHTWLKKCIGPEQSVFVVAADIICANEGPVLDANGEVWRRSLTFERTYIDLESGASLPPETVSGVTSGTSPDHKISPQPPAGTGWRFRVHVTDAAGNFGDAEKPLTFISPYTGAMKITCLGSDVATPPGRSFNLTCQTQRRNETTGILHPGASDAPPTFRINTSTPEGDWTPAVPDRPAEPNPAEPESWWTNWTVPASWNPRSPAVLTVTANMSGATISETFPLHIAEETGSDPITISAAYSWDTHRTTLAIRAAYLNGTGRQGLADELIIRLQTPDLSSADVPVTITEGGAPGSYYATPYLGLAPAIGAWTATVDAPQIIGAGRITATTTFLVPENLTLLVLDQRDLQLDVWDALNRSFGYTWDLLNQSRAESRDNFAYTWDLINATRGLGPPGANPEGLSIEFTGDGAALQYAGRPARLEGVQDDAGPPAWYWTWDFGDNTTGEGPVVYHSWQKPGLYNVTARATTGAGRTNTTTLQVEVRLSAPVLNITGPRVLKAGERGTWTTGSSHDPYDDVSFSFVADPKKVHIWLLGERWVHGGSCGPLNATSLQGPDYAGLDFGPISTQWVLARESCTSFSTAFAKPGEHRIVLYGVNRHGIEKRLDYSVQVLPVREALAPARPGAGPIIDTPDFRPVVDEARENINDALAFLRRVLGG